MLGEIRDAERFKTALSDQSAQRGKILSQCAEHAIPILPVVDFEALESREARVGRDERCRNVGHRAPVGRGRAHVVVFRERLHHGGGHLALERL